MYFIIEDSNKLTQLVERSNGKVFVEVIPQSYTIHPKLASPLLVYIKLINETGYIIPISHTEGAGISIDIVQHILNNFDEVYTISKKRLMYTFTHKNIKDVNLIRVYRNESPITNVIINVNIEFILRRDPHSPHHNNYIPISKWFENFERLYKDVEYDITIGHNCSSEAWDLYNNKYIEVLYEIESQGIKVDIDQYNYSFNGKNNHVNIQDDRVYTYYNPYNTTGRPTNSFNSINYLGIAKEGTKRDSFIHTNGSLIELDYDSYHLRLIGSLLDYKWKEDSPHRELGKQYFKTDVLTEELYNESKSITFRQIYGGTRTHHTTNVEFFDKIDTYTKYMWDKLLMNGFVTAPISERAFTFDSNINSPNKLFNYIIQNYETTTNITILHNIISYLKNHHSRVVLYSYDAILIDWDERDDKEVVLKEVMRLMTETGYPVKIKEGVNYGNLNRINL